MLSFCRSRASSLLVFASNDDVCIGGGRGFAAVSVDVVVVVVDADRKRGAPLALFWRG